MIKTIKNITNKIIDKIADTLLKIIQEDFK